MARSETIDKAIRVMQEDLLRRMLQLGIPAYMHDGIVMYVCDGVEPGGFLTAVFEDGLVQAASAADGTNQRYLYEYASLMYDPVPRVCRGKENMRHWMKDGGLRGMLTKQSKAGAVVDDEETKSGRKVRREEDEYAKPKGGEGEGPRGD